MARPRGVIRLTTSGGFRLPRRDNGLGTCSTARAPSDINKFSAACQKYMIDELSQITYPHPKHYIAVNFLENQHHTHVLFHILIYQTSS